MHSKTILANFFCFVFLSFQSIGQDRVKFQTEIIPKNHFDLSILQVFPDSFPLVSVVFQAKDQLGDPLPLLKKEALGVKENGLWAEVLSLRNITENEPIKIVIVLDKSSSMLEDHRSAALRKSSKRHIAPIIHAKKGIQQFIESGELNQDSVQLIGFTGKVDQVSKFSNQPKYLLKFLTRMHANGATAFYDAVAASVASLEKMEGKKAIIALTDGLDNSSTISQKKAEEIAKTAGIPIYSIGFGGADRKALESLTSATNGFSYFTNDPKQLAAIYLQIKRQIRSIYELRYRSQALDNLSAERDIEFYFTNDSLSFENPDVSYQLPSKAKTYLEERKKKIEQKENLLLAGGAGTVLLLGIGAFFIFRKKKNKLVKTYPNPFKENFTLSYELYSKEGELQVIDASGNILTSIPLNKGKHEQVIDGKDWPTGVIYSLRIAAGGQLSQVRRIVKLY